MDEQEKKEKSLKESIKRKIAESVVFIIGALEILSYQDISEDAELRYLLERLVNVLKSHLTIGY